MSDRASDDPLVSIGMPVRNGAKYMRQALDSLLAQSYERFELIISDNASTDATEQTCREYAARDARIRYYRNAVDLGMATNFNRVFELSSGPFFFWAAHDDCWDRTFIARCVEVLTSTPSAILCYPQAEFIGPEGEPIDYAFPSFDTSGTTTMGMDLASRLHVHMWGITYPFPIKGLMRSHALARTSLARDTFGFDLRLLIELSLLGEFAHIPTTLFYNRLWRQGEPPDRLAAMAGDLKKSVRTKRSALYLCAEMVYGNAEAVNRHTRGFRDKAVLIPSAVFCTIVKYRWLMKALLDLGSRNVPNEQPDAAVADGTRGGAVQGGPRRRRAAKVGRSLALRGVQSLRGRRRKRETTLSAPIRRLKADLDGMQERLEAVREEVEGRLGALDTKLSQAVAGIELGSVPARETTFLGHPFVYPYDSAIGQVIEDGGEWDAILRTAVSELLPKEEPVIWEVGSNIGASLRQMLVAKPRARVVAFEPSRRFRPFLERNVELVGSGQVEVLPLFIGKETGGSKWLYASGTTAGVVQGSNAILDATPAGYEPRDRELVQITSLDELQSDRGPVDFIKVDTDGFDLEVLRGAATTLERDRPVLFFELVPGLAELVPSPVAADLAWLQSVGYPQLVCFDPQGQIVGKTDDPEQAIAWAEANVYCDVLTCFQGSVSKARLAGIKFASPAADGATGSSA